jgi:hypothetical protein
MVARAERRESPNTLPRTRSSAKLGRISEKSTANATSFQKSHTPDRSDARLGVQKLGLLNAAALELKKSQIKKISKPSHRITKTVMDDEADAVKKVGEIYRQYKKCSGGADGGVVGLNGSIRATCLVRMLHALQISGRDVLDFGAGDGRVLLAAVATGATKATGFELPDNSAHRIVFEAVRKSLNGANGIASASAFSTAWPCADWLARDINNIRELPINSSCAYSFWVGMPLPTQEHILSLCARSPSIDSVAVFRDRKWRKPEDGQSPFHSQPLGPHFDSIPPA